ncbi:MAG: hypothetical protein ACXAEU_11895 [Candidatus Hodarchaeales archaeon]|jgi:hypothetical protein
MSSLYQSKKSPLSEKKGNADVEFLTTSNMVEYGAKLLIINNVGWLTIPTIMITSVLFIVFEVDLSLIMISMSLIILLVILLADITGFTIFSIGLLKYDDKSGSARKAGVILLVWSTLTILWRSIFVLAVVFTPLLDSDSKILVYEVLEWNYFACSITILIASYYLAKIFDLAFLAYSAINIISAFLVAPLFIIITDEPQFYLETLILISTIFKLVIIPILAIILFRSVLNQLKVPRREKTRNEQELGITTLDVKISKSQITQWEGFRALTATESKKVIALIKCTNCNENYSRKTIHSHCLYCGEKLPVLKTKNGTLA